MNKIISVLLVIMLLAALPFAASAAVTDSGTVGEIHWDLDASGKLTFTGSGSVPQNGPWAQYIKNVKTIELGEGITEILSSTFDQYSNVTTVILGPDLTRVEGWAFMNMRKIKRFEIYVKQDCISGSLFAACKRPDEIVLGEESPYIYENDMLMTRDGTRLVFGPAKGKAIIPEGIKEVGEYAFYESKITELTLPKSLESIGYYAFEECKSLKSLVVPENVKKISSGMFFWCPALKQVTFLNKALEGDEYSSYSSMFIWCNGLKKVMVPAMETVGRQLVNDCPNLTTIVLGDGTKKIGENAFSDCKKLKEIYIPDSVESIDEGFYDYKTKLTFCCHAGSYAEQFANSHGFTVVTLTSVSGLTLSETSLALAKGKQGTLAVTVEPADATMQTLDWCSTCDSVATVDTKGKVKAVGPGECDIYCLATDGSGVRAVCHVTVE